MSRQYLDISDLPDEARESLRDYYEFLRKRYAEGEGEGEQKKFNPATFRGAINVDRTEIHERLDSLRDEWERHE